MTEPLEQRPPEQHPPERRREPFPAGRLAFGVILVLVGIGALIETAGWGDVPWEILLPVALIVVGGAMILAARHGRARGLFVTGVILSILLAVGSTFDVSVSGGIGDRVIVVTTVEQLEPRYELGVGDLQLDLSGLTLPEGLTDIDVHVGIGDLTVILPAGAEVFVEARASVGDVTIPDGAAEGIDARRTYRSEGYATATSALALDASVSLGTVEVRA